MNTQERKTLIWESELPKALRTKYGMESMASSKASDSRKTFRNRYLSLKIDFRLMM